MLCCLEFSKPRRGIRTLATWSGNANVHNSVCVPSSVRKWAVIPDTALTRILTQPVWIHDGLE